MSEAITNKLLLTTTTTYAYDEEDGVLILTNEDFDQARAEFKNLVVTICEYIESHATPGSRLYQLILVLYGCKQQGAPDRCLHLVKPVTSFKLTRKIDWR
jgi:hypothetical protein